MRESQAATGSSGSAAARRWTPRSRSASSRGTAARSLDYEWGHASDQQRIPPLVAIPTTAGTGSEVTLWAVITDHERKIKFNVGGTPLIGAHVALIDPELMLGLPPAVTAATGMDALSHAIECYTCDYHQPFNDAVALQAMELVGRVAAGRRRGRLATSRRARTWRTRRCSAAWRTAPRAPARPTR